MTNLLRPLASVLLIAGAVHGQEWHVATDGDDGHDGTTPATAFRTPQRAAAAVGPGDVVLLGGGLYTSNPAVSPEPDVLTISTPGTPEAWITWRAVAGQRPVMRSRGWAIVRVNASYQRLEGLVIDGCNEELNLLEALQEAQNPKPDARYNTNGIMIDGRKLARKPHHIVIRGCEVGNCPGGGIAGLETDHITIEDCRVHDNAWYARYGCSGISFLDAWQVDADPGYHLIVRRNLAWGNRGLVPWQQIKRLSDGNGIILDVTDGGNGPANPETGAAILPGGDTKQDGRPAWTARSLVANNISCGNGGSGIHCFRTSEVDIINNTTWHNGAVTGYPELFANASRSIRILNNVIIPRPKGKVNSNHGNTDLLWDYNLYPDGEVAVAGPHDLVADPQTVAAGPDPSRADFALRPGSPAIASGSDLVPLAEDVAGRPRAAGAPDRGACAAADRSQP